MSNSKNRILIVIPSLTLGGAEKQAFEYAKATKLIGLDPIIVGLGREGDLLASLKSEGIRYETIHMANFFKSRKLRKLYELFRFLLFLKKIKADKLIAFTYWPNVLCGCIYKFAGIKTMFWNQRSVDENISISIWEKWAIKNKMRYIANSETCRTFIAKRHRLHSIDEVVVILNTIKFPALNEVQQNQLPILNFVMVANFFEEKDQQTVLKAYKKYSDKEENPRAILHFIGTAPGDGVRLLQAKELAFELGFTNKQVHFHGTLTNVTDFIQHCDIGILSTYSEGFSNAIMEYMVHGLPVIATDIPSNKEALTHENEALIFAINDDYTLSEHLEQLANDAQLRKRTGALNRKIAERMFDRTNFMESLARILIDHR